MRVWRNTILYTLMPIFRIVRESEGRRIMLRTPCRAAIISKCKSISEHSAERVQVAHMYCLVKWHSRGLDNGRKGSLRDQVVFRDLNEFRDCAAESLRTLNYHAHLFILPDSTTQTHLVDCCVSLKILSLLVSADVA